MFDKICIIGVGLIGGSIAIAAREKQVCRHITGYGRPKSEENLLIAQQLDIIDDYSTDLATAVQDADCVLICIPVRAFEPLLRALQPLWSATTLYSDTGSTKGSVVDALCQVFGSVPENFVLAHPIAGAEQSGVAAARQDLYTNKRVIFTPVQETRPEALQRMVAFWEALGACSAQMSVQHHDAVLAATSHLPHVLAYSLVDLLGKKDAQEEIFKYAAGGFKDFTRIASSDPTMWLDICMANKKEILPLIQQLQGELQVIADMMEQSEDQQLFDVFTRAKQARQRFLDQFQ